MISVLELCLQGLDHDELMQRAAALDNLVSEGHALLWTDETGAVELINLRPPPELPPLPPALS
jgi:hypothetical protein